MESPEPESRAPARVSVIVPTRDRPELLREALASIRALEGPDLTFEILVGDNGSDPATAAVAAEFDALRVAAYRPGAAAARNAALRLATGEIVAFLDDDDVWLPGHIRPHLDLLAARPAFGGAVGQVANAAPDLSTHGAFWPETLPRDGDLLRAFFGYYPQIGATVVRASAIATVGLFDEALTFDQDWDWHLRLARAYRVGFVPVPCVLFRQRPDGAHDDLQWARLAFSRRVFFANVRRAGLRRMPPPHVLAGAAIAKSGQYAAYFRASARQHLAEGDHRAARRSLLRAVAASPLHAVYHAPSNLALALRTLRPGSR